MATAPSQQPLIERFDRPEADTRLVWLNPPRRFRIETDTGLLLVSTESETDFWQRTHYGFRADSGHFFHAPWHGDFVLETHVYYQPRHQYDQAGLMVRFDEEHWIKTSVECELDEPYRLGAVVTNHGYSDWSTQEFPERIVDLHFRVVRRGDDFFVYARRPKQDWLQLRVTHLEPPVAATPARCGVYCCSPKEGGFGAAFHELLLAQEGTLVHGE